MKILVLADMDDLHWRQGSGEADLVISCGDIADSLILEAAQAWGCPPVLAVKGNHDLHMPFPAPIEDLHLQVREHGSWKFGGFNGSWKYKPRGHFLYEQDEAETLLSSFPPVDIFVSHNSPHGIHDRDDDVHHGFHGLNTFMARVQPRLLIHGHQHVNRETVIGNTRIIGVYGHTILEI